jgi:hypothetical protein
LIPFRAFAAPTKAGTLRLPVLGPVVHAMR